MGQQLFGEYSNYVYGRRLDERQRLDHQSGLLAEDFASWLDEGLRRCGLPTGPQAKWSLLDLGCGAGQYALATAGRYPNATIVGVDADRPAVEAASAAGGTLPNVRFAVHDAREPVRFGGGFDVVVMWMVLLYLPDKAAALRHVASAMRPGGLLMLGNVPDRALELDHPAARAIGDAGLRSLRQVGLLGLADELEPLLLDAGFGDVATATLRYPVGGATCAGQRWYQWAAAAQRTGRGLVVDACGHLDGAEYDRLLAALAAESVLDISGEARFLVTLARRGDGIVGG